jgi:hypothetical protein
VKGGKDPRVDVEDPGGRGRSVERFVTVRRHGDGDVGEHLPGDDERAHDRE